MIILYYNDVFVRYTPVKNYEKDQNNKYSNTIWKHLNFPREKLYYSSKQLFELDFLRKSILQQKMSKIILTFNLEVFLDRINQLSHSFFKSYFCKNVSSKFMFYVHFHILRCFDAIFFPLKCQIDCVKCVLYRNRKISSKNIFKN
jgi:hypothetical protein